MGRPSSLWLPGAERDEHGRALEYTEWTDPKGCLHTTESSDWPDYSGWTIPPQMTVMPIPGKGVEIRQHRPFDQAGFALRNLSGGVETNRDCVWQIELVGTCSKGGPGYFWPDADPVVLRALGDHVIRPVSQILGIPLKAIRFQAYPASYGPRGKTNTVRLSGSAFDNYSGWLGHQHVPENVHGDPGLFPWARMMQLLEDDMTHAEMKAAVLDALATAVIINKDSNPVTKFSVNSALQNIEADGDLDKARLKALTASVAALTAALKLLSSGQALTVKQITAAAEAGAAAALAGGVDVNVTVGGATG